MPDRSLILHTEASPGFGGQEIRILTEAAWLREHGTPVLVVGQPGSRLLAEAQAARIPAASLRMRGALDLPALWRLRRLMIASQASLVHTHSSIDSWLATLAARSLGLPVVRSRHVSIPVVRRRALVYRLADRVITSGEAIRALVMAAGVDPAKVESIAAGVDTARFHPGVSGARVRAELGLGCPLVGLVANVRGSKGHAVFLDAALEIARALPDARFLVVGDGVGFPRVRQWVIERGLAERVVLTGFRRDVPEILAALDVFVLPSTRTEGTPQVILQSLAVGTPVVATSIGDSAELLRDGAHGRLVPPGDAKALAGAILAVLGEPGRAKAMALAGQAVVRERYSLDVAMARTTAVYAEVLAAAARRRQKS